jgi:altronate dehydratase
VPNSSNEPLEFAQAGRIPAPGDNVAIAVRTLPAGTRVLIRQLVFVFAHTVLEGHRFAIFRIRKGDPLLSWGLPFGLALRDIEPGEYVCNEKILRVLRERNVDFELPGTANFLDHRLPFHLDRANFRTGTQVVLAGAPPTFAGFRRNAQRGVGTRNYIVVLGTSSRTGPFARELCRRFRDVHANFPNVDGIVPIDHTEGGGSEKPNNFELTLRTLAGFMVNPNVGAVLCVDYGNEVVSNSALRNFLTEHNYPTEGLLHEYLSVENSYEETIERAAGIISRWIPEINQQPRDSVSISHLRIGLQCGGSDAFSGVSANPIAGILAREVVGHGGSANLAETDELIGAESYVLANVRDLATADAFVERVERFQQWAAAHGHSAEGNPSGGNMYRGLYNISIKSIGAARKKDPATRLDYVIDFGERMTAPGFYFMDSPGNDLESIAGQVAAGCNMILFATGNGSITNFPFVPTIKIMTTTRRFELVRNEMDFNAGRYLDGEPLEALGREAFEDILAIASGKSSAGERAGHSQVQLWREWRNNAAASAEDEIEEVDAKAELIQRAKAIVTNTARPRLAFVLPTSLCSGQIAQTIAEQLNQRRNGTFDRALALPHTEGCGNSGGESEQLFMRTMAGYLAHPFVSRALLLEHGCEKTHNDAFRNVLRDLGLNAHDYAFRSVQLDGGIERVVQKSLDWFKESNGKETVSQHSTIALHGRDMPPNVKLAFSIISSAFARAEAAVVRSFGRGDRISYGDRVTSTGTFRMETPTNDPVEILTGLGATGAEMIIAYLGDSISPGNPMVPTVRLGRAGEVDLEIQDTDPAEMIVDELLQLISEVRSETRRVTADRLGNVAFQITRGFEGISL